MALGLTYGSGSGGEDIVPFVKYDARAGRFFRNDRTQGSDGAYTNASVDITGTFKAVMDLENIEVGYILFGAGSAPEFQLVKLGQPMPANPGGKFKQGCRLMMKLHQSCGGDVREISSTAAAFLKGIDDLHTAYEVEKGRNPGKLPIVTVTSTTPITSGSGANKSTNYQPTFSITGWAPRPNDLTHVAKKATTPAASAAQATAPATGSTQVSAPAAKQLEPAGADDFG